MDTLSIFWREFDEALIERSEAKLGQYRISLDTNLKITSSCSTTLTTIQKRGVPGLQSLPKMEKRGWITWRPCYQRTGARPLPRSVSV